MKTIFSTLSAFALAISLGVAVIAAPHPGSKPDKLDQLAPSPTKALGERQELLDPFPIPTGMPWPDRQDEVIKRGYRIRHHHHHPHHNNNYKRQESEDDYEGEDAIETRQFSGLLGALGGLGGNGGGTVQPGQLDGLADLAGGAEGDEGTVQTRQLQDLPLAGVLDVAGDSGPPEHFDQGETMGSVDDTSDEGSGGEAVEKRQSGLLEGLVSGQSDPTDDGVDDGEE